MLTNFQSKYKIQCKIGEGAFSEVLKCLNRETNQLIAAKRLKKTFRTVTEAAEIPEVIAMRKLPRHQNILHLIEAHYEPMVGKVTLICDLMDMSIYDMMKTRKRPLPESRVKNYLHQILKGIAHLHNHGVFHRDIKPENILIQGDLIKVADLGSVRGVYSKPPYTEYISTRWYRSPECLLTSGFYGSKLDVWAIGCVFYELLTLKPLFPGSNEIDQIAKIHAVLGTPSQIVLSRIKKQCDSSKSHNSDISFPVQHGTGFGPLVQNISQGGKELLKMMLVYDPKLRSTTRRLLENRYFNDLREADLLKKRLSTSSTSTVTSVSEWRNPVLLSFMTSERKRKQKLVNVPNSKVPRPIPSTIKSTSKPKLHGVNQNPSKVSINKPLVKTEAKTKLVQKGTHRMQPAHQRSQILKETTNILHVPSANNVTSSNSAEITRVQIQPTYAAASTSFLPPLTNKTNTVHGSITKTNLLRNNKHRQIIEKPFLNSSNKPKLEPIMEHMPPRQTVPKKLMNSMQQIGR